MKMLTVKQVSELTQVKEKTIYQWVEMRQIPHYKLNGAIRFNYDVILEWMNSCARQADNSYNLLSKLEARKGGKKK